MGSVDNLRGNDFARAFELAYTPVIHGVFATALELNVFEIIAKAGFDAHLSAAEIASHFPKQTADTPEILDRMLLLLASQSVLECSNITGSGKDAKTVRLYGLNSVSRFFVADENGITQLPSALWVHANRETCYSLKDAILEGGIPFNKVHGMSLFETLGRSPKLNEWFNQAMHNRSALIMKGILEEYKGFENVKKLVDVGGGYGSTIKAVVSKYPQIRGINFELPHVVRNAPSYPGVEHVQGDMFEEIPKADAVILKNILHDWKDDTCLKILRNCWNALKDCGGKVIVIEMILPEYPSTDIELRNAFTSDITMHCFCEAGKERTQLQFEDLAKRAGFNSVKVATRFYQWGLIEFYKY